MISVPILNRCRVPLVLLALAGQTDGLPIPQQDTDSFRRGTDAVGSNSTLDPSDDKESTTPEASDDRARDSQVELDARSALERRLRMRVRDISRGVELGEDRAFALMDVVPVAVQEWLDGTSLDASTTENPKALDAAMQSVLATRAWRAGFDLLSSPEQERYEAKQAKRAQAVVSAQVALIMTLLRARLFLSAEQSRDLNPIVQSALKHPVPESVQAAIERMTLRQSKKLSEILTELQIRRLETHAPTPHFRGHERSVSRRALRVELDAALEALATRHALDTDDLELLRDATQRGIDSYVSGARYRKRALQPRSEPRFSHAAAVVLTDPLWLKLLATVTTPQVATEFEARLVERNKKLQQASANLVLAQTILHFALTDKQGRSLASLLGARNPPRRAGPLWAVTLGSLQPIRALPFILGRSGAIAMKDVLDDDQDEELNQLFKLAPDYVFPEGRN